MKKTGFTLIEILVVMALMSIILSIGYININKFNHKKEELEFNEVIRDVSEVIYLTKAKVMYEHSYAEIFIEEDKLTLIVNSKEDKVYNLKSGYKFYNYTPSIIKIFDMGYVEAGHVMIKNKSGKSKSISIKPVTGFIEIID